MDSNLTNEEFDAGLVHKPRKAPIYTEFDYIELGNEFASENLNSSLSQHSKEELKHILGEPDKTLEVYNDDFVAKVSADLTIGELDLKLQAYSKMTIITAPAKYKLSRVLGEMFSPLEKRSVLGLELLHLDGSTSKAGGQVIKNVAGYDLRKLYLGSFNSLAFIRSAYIRLEKTPMLKLLLTEDMESLDNVDFQKWRSLFDFDVNQIESRLFISKDFAYEGTLPFTLGAEFYGTPDLLELRKQRILKKTGLDLNVLIMPFKKLYPSENQFKVDFFLNHSNLKAFVIELSSFLKNLVKESTLTGYAENEAGAEVEHNTEVNSENLFEASSQRINSRHASLKKRSVPSVHEHFENEHNAEVIAEKMPLEGFPHGVLKLEIDLINATARLFVKPRDFEIIRNAVIFQTLNSKYQPVIRIRPLTLDNRLIERALNLSVSQDELQLLRKIKEKFDPEGRLNPGLLI
ncbi:MAG: FAD-linked oxidase C-terminal domain-containing protein [Vampirovibrionia bacterium]